MDVTRYQPVINDLLRSQRVPKNRRDDVTQECYLALLKKQEHLEYGETTGEDTNYATSICWGAIQDERRARRQDKAESLSDPRTRSKAERLSDPFTVEDLDREVDANKLEEALLTLSLEEYQVVYGVFFLGWTLNTAVEETGLTKDQVRWRKQQGIQKLRKYFKEA